MLILYPRFCSLLSKTISGLTELPALSDLEDKLTDLSEWIGKRFAQHPMVIKIVQLILEQYPNNQKVLFHILEEMFASVTVTVIGEDTLEDALEKYPNVFTTDVVTGDLRFKPGTKVNVPKYREGRRYEETDKLRGWADLVYVQEYFDKKYELLCKSPELFEKIILEQLFPITLQLFQVNNVNYGQIPYQSGSNYYYVLHAQKAILDWTLSLIAEPDKLQEYLGKIITLIPDNQITCYNWNSVFNYRILFPEKTQDGKN